MCANDLKTTEPKITCIEVRAHGEWATFFVKELQPVMRPANNGLRFSANWAANSSFGAFAHYWHDMGEPFGEFIKDVDEHYLLGKIATTSTDSKAVISNVKREVIRVRRQKEIDADAAREAFDVIEQLAAEYDGNVLCHELYQASELSFISDWVDLGAQDFDQSAKQFAKKLWPEFVRLFREQKARAAA